MRKETITKLQEKLIRISVESVGRSMPAGVYERKIPEEVLKRHRDAEEQ